jgi:8-oxo-dGTP pyrophosphatase MutT (NUDIX family)
LGGGLKPGEDHLAAAMRELFEEAGLKICPEELRRIDMGMAAESKRYYQTFVVVVPQQFEPVCDNGEITAFYWLQVDEYWRRVNSDWDAWCGRLKDWHLEKIRIFLAAQ